MEITREELNGLGARVNGIDSHVSAHTEAISTIKDTMKDDRRDLWNAITGLRNKVDGIAIKVSAITATGVALQLAVYYFTKK